MVKTITLSEIITTYNYKDDFALVCDIEGTEVEIIINDFEILNEKCKMMIIELNETNYDNKLYTKNEIANLIKDKCAMNMAFNDNKTWVFVKSA